MIASKATALGRKSKIQDRNSKINSYWEAQITSKFVTIIFLSLATFLILCNCLWLFTTLGRNYSTYCIHDQVWGGAQWNNTSDKQDYELVRGGGSERIPFPFLIPNDTVILGVDADIQDGEKRFMTIGISSVWRKENYLYRTLNSLFKESTKEDQHDFYIFLLLADANEATRKRRAIEIGKIYKAQIDSGVLLVLQPNPQIYPSINFSSIRRTYNDPISRVQWRTKQVLDFSFLIWYAHMKQTSEYFLVMEDDIMSANHFVTAIKEFVDLHHGHHWVSLQVADFLGIGQLIHTKDLEKLVSFLVLFYKEHPVDILLEFWVSLMVPDKPCKDRPTRRVPGLFQHIGVHSTLPNKIQNMRDKAFDLVHRRFAHLNPHATIATTIKRYKSFMPELAYSPAPGMFWGTAKGGDTFDIVFSQPLQLYRLVIITGTNVTEIKSTGKLRRTRFRHILVDGHVEISKKFVAMAGTHKAICKEFAGLAPFAKGVVDVTGFQEIFSEGVQCIRIYIGVKQPSWLAISEIAVFTMDEEAIREGEN